ncbi:unnamed protein product [Mytilus edulis]|uniref:DZIP3-like HEPN domain-containing protein n=1 Tax=Mytilus edulis TaxID=6550 RepID=A0A8S3RCE3_MYTED|nr:unnamed protein product [Mytilus edulis]
MASLSEEEENYVRLALLLKGVTPRAVRTYFDREFPPTSLSSTLRTSHNTLLDLKVKRIINQAQWNLLIPRNGRVPDSKTFDVTLMICLIRNLTSINPAINGFDSLPLPGETTPGSDLARIKCYRNKLAHHDSNTIDTTYFNTAWREISEAVSRLGGQTMYQECQDLKVKILDQSNQEIMLEIKQSVEEMKELKLTVDNLGMEHSRVTENLRELQTFHNTLQTEYSKVMEIVKDPIRENIKELIKKQIDDWEKKDKMMAVVLCTGKLCTAIVILLLERNPNVNLCDNDGFTPLISSCISNHISIVQLLMKHKPNINAQTYDGGSALYFSAWNGNVEIMQLLLENNADCNICGHSKQKITDALNNDPSQTLDEYKQGLFDSFLKNALPHVADYISKKSVDYVFDVDAGSSPLHIACFMGRIDVVRCLLDHNANINMTKEDGTTPLFYACEVGHEDIVRLLLDKGADTQICRLDGKSPLDIATDNGRTSIVMMLTNHIKEEDKLSS